MRIGNEGNSVLVVANDCDEENDDDVDGEYDFDVTDIDNKG